MKYKVQREWLTLIIDDLFDGKTIEDVFRYYHLSRKNIHLLKQNKGYTLNQQCVPASTILSKKDQLKIKAFDTSGIDLDPVPGDIEIAYEDEFLLIVNKPAGVKIHPDSTDVTTLSHLVAYYYQQQGLSYPIRYLHRLDEDTSGLIIFCKCTFLQAYLDHQLSLKNIKRNYIAFVEGNITNKKYMPIEKTIARDRHHSKKMRVADRGQYALTHYRLIKKYRSFSEIECSLETGRTHQIRVHLASIGHPILGDPLYGYSNSKIKRQALHAYKIYFKHPITQEIIDIEVDLPQDMKSLT